MNAAPTLGIFSVLLLGGVAVLVVGSIVGLVIMVAKGNKRDS